MLWVHPSVASPEDVSCVEPEIGNIEVLSHAMKDVLSELNPASNKGHDFINCSDLEKSGIEIAFQTTMAANQNILNALETEAPKHPELRASFNQARRKLHCIQRKLPNLKVQCGKIRKNFAAITFPQFSRRIYIDPDIILKHSLEYREDGGTGGYIDYLGAVLTHEASHKCGAGDATYFSNTGPHNTRFTRWPRIADTYLYWNLWGFCVPGKTCDFPKKPHQD